jgi:hypothetical protein
MKLVAWLLLGAFAYAQTCGSGVVVKLLSDDTKGIRHQRFIIKEPSGKTLLVAHNIDLAPKVQGLKRGSLIKYCGDYEYNVKGGVIHWTHHDPNHQHRDGWLEYRGKRYQ